MKITCTAVRIPTVRAHAESITLETRSAINRDDVLECLKDAPGVVVQDDPERAIYPMPLTSSHKDPVAVGRIRQSLVFENNGIEMFVCGDQVRRGAALNAVLIAERLNEDENKGA